MAGKTLTKEEGVIRVKRTKFGQTTEKEEIISVRPFATATATVGYNGTRTVNLGNYNSIKVGVFCSLPCYVEELDSAFKAAKKFVEDRMEIEIEEIESSQQEGAE